MPELRVKPMRAQGPGSQARIDRLEDHRCMRCGRQRLVKGRNRDTMRAVCRDCAYTDPLYMDQINSGRSYKMTRLPHGAKQLISQIDELRGGTSHTPGEPDGLGVIRTITFDEATSEWLEPILAVGLDPRIESADRTEDGLAVTFKSHISADKRDPFTLREVDQILNQEPEEQVETDPVADLPELEPKARGRRRAKDDE